MQLSPSRRKQKFQLHHPHISKVVDLSKCKIPRQQISQQQYNKIRNQLISRQQQIRQQLNDKIQTLTKKNALMSKSLQFYSVQKQLQQLQNQLQQIQLSDKLITQQIENCKKVQQTSTSQEYFLFKKKQRYDTFNQSIELLYQEVQYQQKHINEQLQSTNQQIEKIKRQIQQMKKEHKQNKFININNNSINDSCMESSIKQKNQHIQQSKIDFDIQIDDNSSDINFDQLHLNINKIKDYQTNPIKLNNISDQSLQQQQFRIQQQQSLIQQQQQLLSLQQQHKSILQTIQILSQNNQILTVQLFNNIQTIQQRINQYYELQKSKLFKDITKNKEDLELKHSNRKYNSDLPLAMIQAIDSSNGNKLHNSGNSNISNNNSPPSVQSLISNYKNHMLQITSKLSPELKSITSELTQPLKWQNIINYQDYFQLSQHKQQKQQLRQSQIRKSYSNFQFQINKESQQIKMLELQLQEIIGETIVFKQKQNQLEMDINNLKKKIRQSNIRLK